MIRGLSSLSHRKGPRRFGVKAHRQADEGGEVRDNFRGLGEGEIAIEPQAVGGALDDGDPQRRLGFARRDHTATLAPHYLARRSEACVLALVLKVEPERDFCWVLRSSADSETAPVSIQPLENPECIHPALGISLNNPK